MSEESGFPQVFECTIGGPESRYEAGPDGVMGWVVDPGPTVTFSLVERARYRASVNGEPRPIRRTRLVFDQSEGGRRQKYEAEVEEGESVDLGTMMKGLGFGPSERRVANGIELASCDNWGHFRQWNFYRTTITLGEDGAVEVEEELGEMDGSYY